MGGTIRAALNLAEHVAPTRPVQIITTYRRRDTPFFGEFPPGVEVTALDDQRKGHVPRGLRGLVRRVLRSAPSVLYPAADRLYPEFSLYHDVRLVRVLRGGSGILMGTRPGHNMVIALLRPPGYATVGLEQMHLQHHNRVLRKLMQRHYPKLDAFVVLTERDRASYDRHLNGRVALHVIPNTAKALGGAEPDLSTKVVLAAGRLRVQKGFDMLVEAWKPVAERHPDWTLRIRGEGRKREQLKAMMADMELNGGVQLLPATDMGTAMSEASIFALSSRFEGFPLILLEAMSKGLAVVAFDCPTGPGDIVDDHRNGLLVPEADVAALSRGLIEMIEDEELRRRCASQARESALAYTIDAIGPRWDALLSELARRD
jgi:glycosyltransferase involved in cell wall biosynthesis